MPWPQQYLEVVEEVKQKLRVEEVEYEAEISGQGGAQTFRARTGMAAGIGRRVVLKIGKPKQIEDELNRYREAENHFGTHPALRDFNGGGEVHSWLAMSVALEGLGETLRDRFDGLSNEEIDLVIAQLFERAIRLYQKTGFNEARSAFGQYALHPNLVPNLRDIGDAPYTLADWWEHATASDQQQSTEAFIHGDLHGGNVLLAGNGKLIQVSLIDFGLSGKGHAYRDLAKLERDLCLFVQSATDNSTSKRLSAIDSQLREKHLTNAPEPGCFDHDVERAVRAIRQIRDLAKGFARVADGDRWKHEYDVALTAQFIFCAANQRVSLAKRRAALERAHMLRDSLIERSPALEPDRAIVHERELEDKSWKIAYSLLRLDQLPLGGWSRSLPQWMEALWEGEHGTVIRSPTMKDHGGADSAGYAVHLLSQFAARLHPSRLWHDQGIRRALQACALALQDRVGLHGGLDEGTTTRGKPPDKKVRHTLIGLLIHLNCERVTGGGFEQGVGERMVDYLIEVLPKWEDDRSHLFGMYVSAVALWRALGEPPAYPLRGNWSNLRECLNEHLPEMAMRLANVMYEPKPEGTFPPEGLINGKIGASFLIPYYGLWRMERSNALMFLPLLFDESGSWSRGEDELLPVVVQRIGAGLTHLLEEIQATGDHSEGLIRYHASVGRTHASRDWGLSAEFARLLEIPAIQALIENAGVPLSQLDHKRSTLKRALFRTLAEYGKYHQVFRLTHGLSAGAYLSEEVVRRIGPRQVADLEDQIGLVRAGSCSEETLHRAGSCNKQTLDRAGSCSEQTLHRLAQCILTGKMVPAKEDQKSNSSDEAKMLTELFVRTFVAGDHSSEHWNSNSYDYTIAHFNTSKYKPNRSTELGIQDTLFLRLMHVFPRIQRRTYYGLYEEQAWFNSFTSFVCSEGEEELHAADLGCGDGRAAKWLIDRRFHVTLVDGSEKMCNRAEDTLRDVDGGKFKILLRDVRKIDRYLKPRSFDLVIANALFVHISPMHAGNVLSKVYDVLKPGGCFFFNVKIRDNTLVSLDDRYFAYYPNSKIPKSMLQTAGFKVDEVALRENDQTCYGVPKNIYWANFYCEKPA